MQGFPLRAGEPRGIPLSTKLLPEHLKRLGYSTRLIGKWHLGYYQANFTPARRGFDSFFGYYSGYITYFNHTITEAVSLKFLNLSFKIFNYNLNLLLNKNRIEQATIFTVTFPQNSRWFVVTQINTQLSFLRMKLLTLLRDTTRIDHCIYNYHILLLIRVTRWRVWRHRI